VLGRRVVFLENYDMAVARSLVHGVDVWLNTPRRPLEASGTSGMKAAANAVLNFSIPDGWWDEVWKDPHNSRFIGWTIGKGEQYSDPNYQDQVEAEALYDLLEREVIPIFYERGADRLPRKWVDRMKASVGSICPFVNTHRMVRDYVQGYYVRAHAQFRLLERDNADRARDLAAAMGRIRAEWHDVWIENVEDGPANAVPVSTSLRVRVRVHLGRLKPEDVLVETYVGGVDLNGDLVEGHAVAMQQQGPPTDGGCDYVVETSIARSGLHGFTVRVRPYHPDMSASFIPGLIRWADQSRLAVASSARA
jgi:glycogen phosphorylase